MRSGELPAHLNRKDGHHVISTARQWKSLPEAEAIRETPSLIPNMWRADHNYIHEMTPPIPLLGHNALLQTVKYFKPKGELFQDIDELCFAIDKANKHPKTHELERDLGQLAVRTIRAQVPYLYDAMDYSRMATVIDFGSERLQRT